MILFFPRGGRPKPMFSERLKTSERQCMKFPQVKVVVPLHSGHRAFAMGFPHSRNLVCIWAQANGPDRVRESTAADHVLFLDNAHILSVLSPKGQYHECLNLWRRPGDLQ